MFVSGKYIQNPHFEAMETMKMENDHAAKKMDSDDEYVKVEKVDDYMELEMEDDSDGMEYVKVQHKFNDLEIDPFDGSENEATDDDSDIVDTVEDMEIEDPYSVVLYKRRFYAHYAPLAKAMEIKDLVKDIVLPYLPAKSISRFKSVSKEWDKWIKSPFLAHQQSYCFKHLSGFFIQTGQACHKFVSLDQTAYGLPTSYLGSFLPEHVSLLSSSNGLLLCQGPAPLDQYYVCNPATQEWTILPSPTVYNGFESAVVLAFDPSVLNMEANYCAIRVISVDGFVFFDVYSSQKGSWEVSGTILVDMEGTSIKDNGCFYMNGIIYMETTARSVIAFDPVSGLYEVISVPFEFLSDGVLTQIKGELCYIRVLGHMYGDMYSIMIYAGMELSLKRQLSVTIGRGTSSRNLRHSVLPCFDGDNVMVMVDNVRNFSTIYSCSTRDGSVRVVARVEGGSIVADSNKFLPYVNSLVHVA